MRRIAPLALSLLVILAGCGGDDDDSASDEPTDETTVADDEATDETEPEATDETTDESGDDETSNSGTAELPQFASDFSATCDEPTGFDGTAAYDASSAGPHPTVIFTDRDGEGLWVARSGEYPPGWVIEEDADFEDNSDLAPTELIVCAAQASTSPNGTDCELELDGGDTVSLELVDVTYELTVYNAATGEAVGDPVTVDAATTECPFFVAYEEGQTQYFNEMDDQDLVDAVKPFIEPA